MQNKSMKLRFSFNFISTKFQMVSCSAEVGFKSYSVLTMAYHQNWGAGEPLFFDEKLIEFRTRKEAVNHMSKRQQKSTD